MIVPNPSAILASLRNAAAALSAAKGERVAILPATTSPAGSRLLAVQGDRQHRWPAVTLPHDAAGVILALCGLPAGAPVGEGAKATGPSIAAGGALDRADNRLQQMTEAYKAEVATVDQLRGKLAQLQRAYDAQAGCNMGNAADLDKATRYIAELESDRTSLARTVEKLRAELASKADHPDLKPAPTVVITFPEGQQTRRLRDAGLDVGRLRAAGFEWKWRNVAEKSEGGWWEAPASEAARGVFQLVNDSQRK